MSKIIAFFTAIWMFILSLFGIGGTNTTTTDTFTSDLAYGSNTTRQIVDIAYPENASGEQNLILFIHGGAWVAGSKDDYTDTIKSVAKNNGYVTAAMNYRYASSTVDCSDMLDDITAALKAIQSDASSKGITIKNVAFTGMSAGAHLDMLYAYTRAAECPFRIAFVFEQSGPTDLADVNDNTLLKNSSLGVDYVAKLFSYLTGMTVTTENVGDADVQAALKAISPVYHADTAVPTIIAHGLVDTVVPYVNATVLDAALTANGVTHKFITYPNSNHDLGNDPDCATEFYNEALNYAGIYFN